MKRSNLKEVSMEIMVGAFIFMVLLALAFFTIILSYENFFTTYYKVEAKFDHVRGLRQGDNVFLRGVLIGRVKGLKVEQDGVRVLATLEQEPQLRKGYKVEILSSSVLGGQYLSIYEGPPGGASVPLDTLLNGTTPVDLMAEATSTIKALRDALEEGEILSNLKNIMAQFSKVSDDIAEGRGTLGKLIQDDEIYDHLRELTEQLSGISTRLAEGKGTLGRLLSEDETLYSDLSEAAASIKNFTGMISRGEGTLGKLVSDDALYQEAQLLLHEIRATIDDFRETAPITTFTSIFFGAF
jgi:phospholipid/cholesterol/gamma-HCH transport system substrate-binding protein